MYLICACPSPSSMKFFEGSLTSEGGVDMSFNFDAGSTTTTLLNSVQSRTDDHHDQSVGHGNSVGNKADQSVFPHGASNRLINPGIKFVDVSSSSST